MKKLGLCVLAMTVIALMFSGSALAQGDSSYYFTTYYSNNVTGAPDGTVRFINDGDTGGWLYAAIYVFDDSQELQECGACGVSPDGVLAEDVKTQLTANTVTSKHPARGVIKVISSSSSDPTTPAPTAGLRGWATHIQSAANKGAGPYATTETAVADSNLGEGEASMLGTLCAYAQVLGSGQGTITCTPEDSDF